MSSFLMVFLEDWRLNNYLLVCVVCSIVQVWGVWKINLFKIFVAQMHDNLNYFKWFKLLSTRIIWNSLSTAAKDVDLQLEGRGVTNHSVRKTCILRLLAADIRENSSAQLCEHKTTDSQRVRNTKGGCPWPSVELLVSKPVWNNECQVATCSAAEIATSTQKIHWSWTILTPPYCLTPLYYFLAGANVRSSSGCTFQIFHGDVKVDTN